MTREERFLLKLYELTGEVGKQIDSHIVGQALAERERGIKTIVQTLAQVNFVKRGSEPGVISLTAHGLKLVHELQK